MRHTNSGVSGVDLKVEMSEESSPWVNVRAYFKCDSGRGGSTVSQPSMVKTWSLRTRFRVSFSKVFTVASEGGTDAGTNPAGEAGFPTPTLPWATEECGTACLSKPRVEIVVVNDSN